MARDINRFVRQHKESTVRYNSKLDFICNKYAEQNEKEEDWVVDLSSMDFTRDTNGLTDEFAVQLQRVKYSKEIDSGKVFVRNFKNGLENEDTDPWLSGEEGEVEDQPRSGKKYEILKDMSTCMEQFYDGEQSEPSDGETLSSVSRDSDITLYSDYSSSNGESDMSDDERYVDPKFERPENGKKKVDRTDVSKIEQVAGKNKDGYSSGSPKHHMERRTAIKSDLPKGRQVPDGRENVTTEERQNHRYSPKPNIQQQYNRYTGLDLFDSGDVGSDGNKTERNNNTHKARLNVMQEQPQSGVPKSRMIENSVPKLKEPRHRHSDSRHVNKSPGNDINEQYASSQPRHKHSDAKHVNKPLGNDHFQVVYSHVLNHASSQQDNLSRSNVCHQDSRFLDAAEEPMDNVPTNSYGPRACVLGRQVQNDRKRHYNKPAATYDSPKEQGYNIDSETYTISPKNTQTGMNIRSKADQNDSAAEWSPRYANEYARVRQNNDLKLSVRKKLSTATDYKQFNESGTQDGSNINHLNGRNSASADKNSKRLGLNRQNILRSPRSSAGDNAQYDSVFEKSSKKDSGICSYMDDTHESEKNLIVLSVKNLEAFNESYSEKWSMEVSMNQSDLVKKTEQHNEKKIHQWLSSFKESIPNEQDDSSYLQVSDGDIPDEGLVMNSTPRKVSRESGRSDTPMNNRNRIRHTSGYGETVDTACQTVAKSPMHVEAEINSPRQAHRRKISPRLSSPHQGSGKAAEKRLIKRVARSLKDSGDGESHRKTRDIGKMIRNVYSSPIKYRMIEESLVRSSSLNNGKRLAEDLDYDADTTDDVTGIDFVPTPPKSRRTSLGSRIGDGDGKSRQTGSKNMKTSGRQVEDVRMDQSRAVQRQAMNGAGFVSVYSDGISYRNDESRCQPFDSRDKRLSVSDSTISHPQYGNSYGRRNEMIQDSRNMPRIEYDDPVNDRDMSRANRLEHTPRQDLNESAQSGGQECLLEEQEYIRANELLSDTPDPFRSDHINNRAQKSPHHYSEAQNVRLHQLTNRSRENSSVNKDPVMYRNHRENLVLEARSQQTYVKSDRPTMRESVQRRPAVDGYDGRYQDDRNVLNSYGPKVQKESVQNNRVLNKDGNTYSQSKQHYENSNESYNKVHSHRGPTVMDERVNIVDNCGQDLNELTNRRDRDTIRYRSQRQNIYDSDNIQSGGLCVNRQNERLPRSGMMSIDRGKLQSMNSDFYSPGVKYRSPRHLYHNDISDLEEIQKSRDSFRDNGSNITPRQTNDNERMSNFDSPSSSRGRVKHGNSELFSPSGSLAKLRLHTPNTNSMHQSGEHNLHRRSEGQNVRESMCTVNSEDIYDNFSEWEIPASSRSVDSHMNQSQRQAMDMSYQNEMYVENLSDKENDSIDRGGFISLDRIATAPRPVSVQRYSNNNSVESAGRNKRHVNTATHRRSVSSSDRYSPAIERKQTSSDRYSPAIERKQTSSDRYSPAIERKQTSSDRYSPAIERKQTSSDMVFTQDSMKHIRHQRNVQSPLITNNSESSPNARDGTSEAHEGRAFQRRVMNTDYRTNGDALVCAKEAVNRDCNVAQVRKMDVVKKVQAKPRMKKSLFTGTRNVATPVSFIDFAEGISSPGECEMVDGKISRRPSARHMEEFKVPFSVNLQQRVADTNLNRRNIPSRKQFEPQASYRDVMSSTAVDNSRLTSVKLQHRVGNIVHSTPMSGRGPVLLNETISTIQAPEETVNQDDVMLII